MKGWRKGLILSALFCGMLLFTAFGQKETEAEKAVQRALEKLRQAESAETELALDLEAELYRLRIGAEAKADMVTFREPLKLKADVSLDMGWFGDSEFQVYAYEDADVCRLCVKDGKKWNGREAEREEVNRWDGIQMMEAYLEQAKELKEDGKERLSGGMTDRYRGVIRSDGLKAVLSETGNLELLYLLLEQDLLKPLGKLFRQNEELIPELMGRADDLEVTLWIDRQTGYPVQCAMEISGMLNGALAELTSPEDSAKGVSAVAKGVFAGQKGQTGSLPGLWSKLRVSEAKVTVRCGGFNEAEDFDIPGEAAK